VLLIRLKLVVGQEVQQKQKLHPQRNLVDSQKQKILILDSHVLLSLVQMKRNLRENQASKELSQKKMVHSFVDHQEMNQKVILVSLVVLQKKKLLASLVLVLILKKKKKKKKKRKDQNPKLKDRDLDLGILTQREVVGSANDLF
jgi:hypothetical protein